MRWWENAVVGICFVGLGGALCVWGMLQWRSARRSARARAVEAGECVCTAHFPSCICEIAGKRNPRGAGRGRKFSDEFVTPPDVSRCRNLQAYGPTPCHYPACACFPPADADYVR
jgi:hypothetical protein